jgi:hypothetical protein
MSLDEARYHFRTDDATASPAIISNPTRNAAPVIQLGAGGMRFPDGGGSAENVDEFLSAMDRVRAKPVATHTFNRSVDATLAECQAISDQRGGEYQDTWALENLHAPFTRHTLRALGGAGYQFSNEQIRLLVLAALIDVKDSRMLGPWKADTVIDGINYRAAYAELRRLYEEPPEPPGGPAETCPNCDGQKCMDCVLRHQHETCEDDCPMCCPPPGQVA